MSRMEFMQGLERALGDVSSEEREAALQYYNDYLDDAGAEHEQEILQTWGTPQKLAESIKSGMDGRMDAGEFTETGFTSGEEKYCPAQKDNMFYERQKEQSGKKKRKSGQSPDVWKWIAIALLCILLGPVCIPVVLAVLAVIVGIVILVAAVAVLFLAAGFTALLAGVAVAVTGLIKLFTVPAAAAVLFGCGLLLFVLGALITLLSGRLFLKGGVWLFRSAVSLCRRPFHGKI